MNFPIPSNALSLHGNTFYELIDHFCGSQLVTLLKFQLIDNTIDLLEVNDVFAILQYNSDQTQSLKDNLGVYSTDQYGNYAFFVLPGIRLKLEKFIRSCRSLLPDNPPSPSLTASVIIPPQLVQQYPFLIPLIRCLESKAINAFLLDFLENLVSNLASTVRSAHRFKPSVKEFAVTVYILGGRNLYEFLRLNIPGALPTLTTIRSLLKSDKYHFFEGEFQYARLQEFGTHSNCRYAFCAEDCTSVVPKVTYDSLSNSFVGFTLPLENGFPRSNYFSTLSFNELQSWYDQMEKATLLNIYSIQLLCHDRQKPQSPFLLVAYGTNGSYTANDVVSRWSTIFDRCLGQGLRILGFSADADPKNLRAMREATGFFATQRSELLDHPSRFKLHLFKNASWFFLPPEQLFVCLQDGIHICTKLRNRLLSPKAILLMGNQCATVDCLIELIDKYSKIDHGLVVTDICPKDKQNYLSCEKMTNDSVLDCLKHVPKSEATQAYLQIIRSVRLAFVEKKTNVVDRLFHAWTAAFIVRIWSVSLEKTQLNDLRRTISLVSPRLPASVIKRDLFVTMPTLFSIEINAHSLTYLVSLVAEGSLTEDALQISLFNSQMCENTFRAARSMSGSFSSIVNFSVHEFLQRAEKLAVLQSIKHSSDMGTSDLIFPKHHKLSRGLQQPPSSSTASPVLTEAVIEKTVLSAYLQATHILSACGFLILDPNQEMITFEEVNRLASKKLASSRCKNINSQSFSSGYDRRDGNDVGQQDNDGNEEDNDDGDDESEDNEDDDGVDWEDEEEYVDEDDDVSEHGDLSEVTDGGRAKIRRVLSSVMHGMRIFDRIDHRQSAAFFEVEINGQTKFIHKQTASWYFAKNKPTLSSDRLRRVQL